MLSDMQTPHLIAFRWGVSRAMDCSSSGGFGKQVRLFPRRDNFQPVSIRVGDEINAHGRIFKADAAHFLMKLVGFFEILRAEGQVELAFAQVIAFRMILQPGQFQLKIAPVITHIDDDETL